MKSRGTTSLCSRAHLPPACCAQVRQKLFGKNRAVYLRARLTESRWDSTEPEGQARMRLDISGKGVHLRLGSWGGLQAPPAASPAQSPGAEALPPRWAAEGNCRVSASPSPLLQGSVHSPKQDLSLDYGTERLWSASGFHSSQSRWLISRNARSRSWHPTCMQVQEVHSKPLRSTERSRNLSRVQGPCQKSGSPEDCSAG